ncbi:hypothetical protein QN277_004689 [Acacia crassicarpa]|uniref:Bet v I/Major latex protein domain-containing protein n=1 Tax=Acacia crassicarpa TaxID=499986 RepID=A0AAE1J0W5_9FABA|nr:hypothetical protein QN277_004689 [Acacia crassicarpa]
MVSTLEASVELNASALKFLEIFSTKVYELATISPDIVQSLEIVSGAWGSIGLTILVDYTIDGIAQVAKMELASLNLLDLSLTFKVIEGDLLKVYNSFDVILKVTPNVLSGSVVNWTFEYEKPSSDTPDPNSLMEAAVQVSKDVDAYVSNLI